MVQNRLPNGLIAQLLFRMQDAKALFEQGLDRHLARDWRAAEDAYRAALALSPGRPSVLFNLGRLMLDLHRDAEAGEFFSQVLALSPRDAEALSGLGESQTRRGLHAGALNAHARALAIAPASPELQANFARCAAYARLKPNEVDPAVLEPALLACLQGDAVDHQSLANVASWILHARPGTEARALALQKIVVSNPKDETTFTALRRQLLLKGGAADALTFALACQCFLNEYVWEVSDEEKAALQRLEGAPPSTDRFALLACYRKPTRADAAGCAIPPEVMRLLIEEPEIEAALAQQLPGSRVSDAVSRGVQAMYEENPYPRWTGMFASRECSYVEQILDDVAPHAPALGLAVDQPRILVAGGGTGRDPISYARFCRGAQVRAIDLSRASLAHARRKANELGVRNLELAQQDILALDEEGAYDVVSSRGVLHHMAEPELGLQRLVRALKPGGFLMLALYSSTARREVSRIRTLIAKEGYAPTPEGIRACRRRLRRDPAEFPGPVLNALDFYSMSMARDLLFHVQEHQFTLPQISSMLARNGLAFLGFRLADPAVRALYRARWPGDAAMIDLARWHALEEENPLIFWGMYQFWTRRMRGP
jgi:SAM-dependent methyltransferase/tetratricopeptide (TPR) repeat protein